MDSMDNMFKKTYHVIIYDNYEYNKNENNELFVSISKKFMNKKSYLLLIELNSFNNLFSHGNMLLRGNYEWKNLRMICKILNT